MENEKDTHDGFDGDTNAAWQLVDALRNLLDSEENLGRNNSKGIDILVGVLNFLSSKYWRI